MVGEIVVLAGKPAGRMFVPGRRREI